MSSISQFTQKIIIVVQSVPKGRIVSYGQVAAYTGVPRAARQVGWVLRNMEADISLPWWRVINNKGRITIKGNKYSTPELQKKLLEQDGVIVAEDLTVEIAKYRFRADSDLLKKWGLGEGYRNVVLAKYGL